MIDDRESAMEATARDREEELAAAVNFLKALEIHAKDRYDEPQWSLTRNGIGFAPLGNIMAIAAPMKSGKTWLMQIFAGAVLRGDYMGLKCPEKEASVLWFDTEQDKYDTQMILRRLQQICGWPHDEDNERLHIFSLRDFRRLDESKSLAKNRLDGIRAAVEWYRPQVVFVDGIRDLLDDFNDLTESAELVQAFMSLTSAYGCAIWNVLHVNPNTEKMRGHLGTELQNKVTDIFTVTKKKNADGSVQFDVNQLAARHRDIDGFSFRIDDAPRYSIPVMIGYDEAMSQNDSRREELREIIAPFMPDMGGISRTALQKEMKKGGHGGSNRCDRMITEALQLGVLEKTIGGKLRLRTTTDILEKRDDDELPF